MLEPLAKGLILGLVAGLPLGPASAAVADTAIRKSFAKSFAVGLGGAFVDFCYCLAVAGGLGVLVDSSPRTQYFLSLFGGIFLILFGFFTARSRPLDLSRPPVSKPIEAKTFARYFAKGVLISVANPALIVSWVLLAGTALQGLSLGESVAASIGVFCGVLCWFVAVGYASRKGRLVLGGRSVWIPRIAGLLLMAYGAFLVVRAGFAFGRLLS